MKDKIKLISEQTKAEKLGFKIQKYKDKKKEKEKKDNIKKLEKVKKYLATKSENKKILAGEKPSLKIKEFKAPSVLGDENRFFNKQMEETKKSMFFS